MKHIKKDTILKVVFVLAAISLIFAVGLVVGTKIIDSKYQTTDSSETLASDVSQVTVPVITDDLYADDEGKAVTMFDGEPYVMKDNIETILFIGVDASEERDEADIAAGQTIVNQCDVLMLIVIDHDTESYSIIQFNRDTMADVIITEYYDGSFDTRYEQLALAFVYGMDFEQSSEYTMYALSKLLHDTQIDHYVTITMDAIPILNDQVGGVTVTIPEDMSMDDPAMVEGATITLSGEQADIFVRARRELDDPTNINRMSRQRTYIDAWGDLAISKMKEDDDFAIDLILTLSNYLYSDMDASKLSNTADMLSDYTNNGIITIDGESVEGEKYMEFYIDEDSLLDIIKNEFYEPYEG